MRHRDLETWPIGIQSGTGDPFLLPALSLIKRCNLLRIRDIVLQDVLRLRGFYISLQVANFHQDNAIPNDVSRYRFHQAIAFFRLCISFYLNPKPGYGK